MKKFLIIFGSILLVAGAAGYIYTMGEMNSNAYRMARAFGQGGDLETVSTVSIVGVVVGVLLLLIGIFKKSKKAPTKNTKL